MAGGAGVISQEVVGLEAPSCGQGKGGKERSSVQRSEAWMVRMFDSKTKQQRLIVSNIILSVGTRPSALGVGPGRGDVRSCRIPPPHTHTHTLLFYIP